MAANAAHKKQAQGRVPARAATTLDGDVTPSYMKWLAQVRYQPKGAVTLQAIPGDQTYLGGQADIQNWPDGRLVIQTANDNKYLHKRDAFFHELGHAFDYRNLSDQDRVRFRAIMHDQRPTWDGPDGAQNKIDAKETFAEAFRLMALHPWLTTRKGFKRYQKYENETGYDARGNPIKIIDGDGGSKFTFYQLRKIQKLLASRR